MNNAAVTCHTVLHSASAITRTQPVNDTITLDETDRHRRRLRLTSDNGIVFLLELESARLLRENDLLQLSDGRTVRVLAKPEPLYIVSGNDTTHLLQLAWHVGNRHLPTQIRRDHFLIRRDPIIKTMLEQLGATVSEIESGFDPVSGAYNHDHQHQHA